MVEYHYLVYLLIEQIVTIHKWLSKPTEDLQKCKWAWSNEIYKMRPVVVVMGLKSIDYNIILLYTTFFFFFLTISFW